jgi:hypothetical protein
VADNFRRFIRENNNVAWRSFNVEDNASDIEDPMVPILAIVSRLTSLGPGAAAGNNTPG